MNPPLFFFKIVTCIILALPLSVPLAHAGVEKVGEDTYVISGTWSFWTNPNEFLAPSGKNDFGSFKAILFKEKTKDFPGVREMKKTPATFKVKARERTTASGDVNLIVEEILEKVSDSGGQ